MPQVPAAAFKLNDPLRAYIGVARAIVQVLDGAFEHLDLVLGMTADQARLLAEHWVTLSPEERTAARSGATKLQRIVALSADDPLLLDEVLRRLRDDARHDPEVLSLVSGYLAGLAARRQRSE